MKSTQKTKRNQSRSRQPGQNGQAQSSKPAAQKVKSSPSRNGKKQAKSDKLKRTTFVTSREMDFFSEKELVTQTGHDVEVWPLVFLKETIDNALDACEETSTPPIIDIVADACGITVTDNGPGLPQATLKGALDFTVRASNREAYVAPDRGAQGNALKTLLPMPHVVDPVSGKLIIQSTGYRHELTCGADPISQRAAIVDDAIELPTKGTEIRIEWAARELEGDDLWPFDDLLPKEDGWQPTFAQQFRGMIEGFAIFNPHAEFRLDWFGKVSTWKATDIAWEKWKPDRPTSSHWYEPEHLERLVGAYVTHDAENGSKRLIRDFLAEFDGLRGSKKRTTVLEAIDAKRAKLAELVVDGQFDKPRIAALLAAMKEQTRPVKASRLGIIGHDHLQTRLLELGVDPESFTYSKKVGKGDLPWVLESAFGWLKEADSEDERKIFAGANWSAAINNPFRSFGTTGEGLEAALNKARAGAYEPIVFVLHLAHPRVEFVDRGKSALVIGGNKS